MKKPDIPREEPLTPFARFKKDFGYNLKVDNPATWFLLCLTMLIGIVLIVVVLGVLIKFLGPVFVLPLLGLLIIGFLLYKCVNWNYVLKGTYYK